MKNIELTEEHKSKLLEICEKLFHEHDFRINKPFLSKNESLSTIQLGKKNVNTYEEEIHWFEFCVNDLSKRLYKKLDKRKRTYFLFNNSKGIVVYHERSVFTNYYLYFEKEHHLIDYLYEIFKKLK